MSEGSTKRSPYATREDIERAAPFPTADLAAQMYQNLIERTDREVRRLILGPIPTAWPSVSSWDWDTRPLTSYVATIDKIAIIVGRACANRIADMAKDEAKASARSVATCLDGWYAHLAAGKPCPACHPLPPSPKPDPRAAREACRREIDAVLREDARRFPAFATARKAALLHEIEMGTGYGKSHSAWTAETHLRCFHEYERLRGGMTKPSAVAVEYARGEILDGTVAVYERSRSL